MERIAVTTASRGQLNRIVRKAHVDLRPTLITRDDCPAAYVLPAEIVDGLLAEIDGRAKELRRVDLDIPKPMELFARIFREGE